MKLTLSPRSALVPSGHSCSVNEKDRVPSRHRSPRYGRACPPFASKTPAYQHMTLISPFGSVIRVHSPSYFVCTPRENGTTSQAPRRFTDVSPELTNLPITSDSTVL